MNFKKILSVAMSAVVMASCMAMSVSAEEKLFYEDIVGVPTEAGIYRAESTIYNIPYAEAVIDKGKGYSAVDAQIAKYIDIEVYDDGRALFKIYGRADDKYMNDECVFSDFSFTHDGHKYPVTTDMTETHTKVFGRVGAEEVEHQAHEYSVLLPVEALEDMMIDMHVELNTSFGSYASKDVVATIMNFEKQVPAPEGYDTQDSQIVASIELISSTYTVTIPESIDMGELSESALEESGSSIFYTPYDIELDMFVGNDDMFVVIETPKYGELSNGVDTIRYENRLGASASEGDTSSTMIKGTGNYSCTVYIQPDAIDGVSSGDYTDTVTYTIKTKL